ncbi:MAG: integrase core domain-containing protein, partial [Myxococcota bacterium]
MRRRHPSWGPRKLLAWLEARRPETDWPAASSVGELLRREGLVSERHRKPRREPHPGPPQLAAQAPNDLWTADLLTLLDHVSRKCLGLQALDATDGYGVRPVFERAFREAGLPLAILTDNGPPFVAPRGLHGAHERFHRTLKAETGSPVAGNRIVQQRRFNRFRAIYNDERPHEALGQRSPTSQWRPSPRPYPACLPEPEYPVHFLTRLVSSQGVFGFRRGHSYLTSALAGQWIGLEETDDGVCRSTSARSPLPATTSAPTSYSGDAYAYPW